MIWPQVIQSIEQIYINIQEVFTVKIPEYILYNTLEESQKETTHYYNIRDETLDSKLTPIQTMHKDQQMHKWSSSCADVGFVH